MKKFTILGILSVVVLASFYIGTKFSNDIDAVVEPESVKYEMMGYYIDEEKDYASEASDIQSVYRTNMSTSKLKHLLIYIDGIAEEYDVNYNLIKAVITTESAWNVKARSRVNALGLMQVMKACATDFKTPHKEMYDPYVNITVGTMYLAKLLKRFPDVETALVAYNEGPRHAKKYKAEYIYNAKYVLKVTNHLINFESVLLADNS
jgi:soluble lytic murein transglycosylase-like protein